MFVSVIWYLGILNGYMVGRIDGVQVQLKIYRKFLKVEEGNWMRVFK